jgi:hypothetical protein
MRKVRGHPHEMGCISEADLLAGNLAQRLPATDESARSRAYSLEVSN